jgi:hypothetical protein
LNELLDDALSFRRERTALDAVLALQFNFEFNPQGQTIQLSIHSIARAATLNVNRFKFSPAAQHLTPGITRAPAQRT